MEDQNYGNLLSFVTVEPVYNGFPRDLRNWPLNTGSLKILMGMVSGNVNLSYKNTSFKLKTGQSTLFQAINTLNKVQF